MLFKTFFLLSILLATDIIYSNTDIIDSVLHILYKAFKHVMGRVNADKIKSFKTFA